MEQSYGRLDEESGLTTGRCEWIEEGDARALFHDERDLPQEQRGERTNPHPPNLEDRVGDRVLEVDSSSPRLVPTSAVKEHSISLLRLTFELSYPYIMEKSMPRS